LTFAFSAEVSRCEPRGGVRAHRAQFNRPFPAVQ
jgi:hypothetical protein